MNRFNFVGSDSTHSVDDPAAYTQNALPGPEDEIYLDCDAWRGFSYPTPPESGVLSVHQLTIDNITADSGADVRYLFSTSLVFDVLQIGDFVISKTDISAAGVKSILDGLASRLGA